MTRKQTQLLWYTAAASTVNLFMWIGRARGWWS